MILVRSPEGEWQFELAVDGVITVTGIAALIEMEAVSGRLAKLDGVEREQGDRQLRSACKCHLLCAT